MIKQNECLPSNCVQKKGSASCLFISLIIEIGVSYINDLYERTFCFLTLPIPHTTSLFIQQLNISQRTVCSEVKVSSTEILHHFNVHLSFSKGSFPVSDFIFNCCNLTPAQVIPLRNQVNVELWLRHWCTAQSNSMHSRRLFSFSIRPVVVNNMFTRAFNHSQELPLHLRNYFVHSFDEKTKYYRPTVFLHNCSQLTKVFLSIFS